LCGKITFNIRFPWFCFSLANATTVGNGSVTVTAHHNGNNSDVIINSAEQQLHSVSFQENNGAVGTCNNRTDNNNINNGRVSSNSISSKAASPTSSTSSGSTLAASSSVVNHNNVNGVRQVQFVVSNSNGNSMMGDSVGGTPKQQQHVTIAEDQNQRLPVTPESEESAAAAAQTVPTVTVSYEQYPASEDHAFRTKIDR
jgi:hypothetical protein